MRRRLYCPEFGPIRATADPDRLGVAPDRHLDLKTRKKRIAFAFPLAVIYIERLSQGILEYARQHCDWTFTRVPEMLSPSIDWLRHWQGDGAFVLITDTAEARVARKLPFPVVSLSGYLAKPGVPTVTVDYAATGRLAAGHLLDRHFRRFGFYGTRDAWYSTARRDGFAETIRQAGHTVEFLEVGKVLSPGNRWSNQEADLDQWLRKFRVPFAVFASFDLRATMVNDACQRVGLRVPEDVAIIGSDNDPVACELCHPPLTSIARNEWQLGWEAARLLDRLMSRQSPPLPPPLRVPPEGVVARRSTDTLAVEDGPVAELTQYVRSHLHETFGVERLVERSKMSRRVLETRFKECLGRSPYTFIIAERVELACRLLAAPGKRTLTHIAAACGFSELRRFRIAFQRVAGVNPAEFRRNALKKTVNPPARRPSQSSAAGR